MQVAMEEMGTVPSSSISGPPQKRRKLAVPAHFQNRIGAQHAAYPDVFAHDQVMLPSKQPATSLRYSMMPPAPSGTIPNNLPHHPSQQNDAQKGTLLQYAQHAPGNMLHTLKARHMHSHPGDMLPSFHGNQPMPPQRMLVPAASLGLTRHNHPSQFIQSGNLPHPDHRALIQHIESIQRHQQPRAFPREGTDNIQKNACAWVLGSQAAGQTHPASRAWVSFRVPDVETNTLAHAYTREQEAANGDELLHHAWHVASPEESTGSVTPETDEHNVVTGPVKTTLVKREAKLQEGADAPMQSQTNGAVCYQTAEQQETTSYIPQGREMGNDGLGPCHHGQHQPQHRAVQASNHTQEHTAIGVDALPAGIAVRGKEGSSMTAEQQTQQLDLATPNKAVLTPRHSVATGLEKLRKFASELNNACLPNQQAGQAAHSPLLSTSGNSNAVLQPVGVQRLSNLAGVKRPTTDPECSGQQQHEQGEHTLKAARVQSNHESPMRLTGNLHVPLDSPRRRAIDAIRIRLQQHHQMQQALAHTQGIEGLQQSDDMHHRGLASMPADHQQQRSNDPHASGHDHLPGTINTSPTWLVDGGAVNTSGRIADGGQTSSATMAVVGSWPVNSGCLQDGHGAVPSTSTLRAAQQPLTAPNPLPWGAAQPPTQATQRFPPVPGNNIQEDGARRAAAPGWVQPDASALRNDQLAQQEFPAGGMAGMRDAGVAEAVLQQQMGFMGALESDDEASMLLVNVKLRQQLRVLQKLCLLLGRKLQAVQQHSLHGLEQVQKQLARSHVERERLSSELEAACRHAGMLSDTVEREKAMHQRQLVAMWGECCQGCRDRMADRANRNLARPWELPEEQGEDY